MEEENQFTSLYEQYFKNNNPQLTEQSKVILKSIEQTLRASPSQFSSLQQNYSFIYCSLLSLLQINVTGQNHETTISLLFLLNFTIPQLSLGVIQRTENQLFPLLHRIFRTELENKQNIQKYCLHVISKLLSALVGQQQSSNLKQSYELLMECMVKESLTLRTLSCHIFTKLFTNFSHGMKEVLFEFSKFLLNQLQLPDSNAQTACKSLQQIILTFPMNLIYDLVYQLMRLFQLSQDYTLNTHILLIIEKVMANKQIESDVSENVLKQCLENGMMLVEEDERFVFAYAQTVVQTLLQLNTFNAKKAERYIAACLSVCSEIFFLGDNKFQQFAGKSMQMILSYTIRPNLWIRQSLQAQQQQQQDDPDQLFDQFFSRIERLKLDEEHQQSTSQNQKQSTQFTQFYKIVYIIKYLLSQRFEAVQEFTLNVVSAFFEQIDQTATQFVEEIITTLAVSRNKRPQIAFKKCFGTIIQQIGVEAINRLFPITFAIPEFLTMNSENYEQSSNLWLLPIYCKSIKNESIITFIDIFNPLIIELEQKLSMYEDDPVKQKFFQFLIGQLWAIFPKCTQMPCNKNNAAYQQQLTQLSQFLPMLTNLLLSEIPNYLQKAIYEGTGQLFINLSELTMEFSSQAEQIFPRLVQKLRINASNSRMVLSALSSLSRSCGKQYLQRVFGSNLKKIASNVMSSNSSNSGSILTKTNLKNFDVLIEIAANLQSMDEFFDQIMQLFKQGTLILQKSAETSKLNKRIYKLVRITIQKMHFSYLGQIQETLQQTMSEVENSYRYQRLACVKQLWESLIIQRIESPEFKLTELTNFVQQFLPEVLLTFTDKNHRIRKLGSSLFDSICGQMRGLELLNQFTELLTGGLAGQSKSALRLCTLQSLGRIAERFKSEVEESIRKVEEIALLLINEDSSDVYLSTLKFVIKMVKNYPHTEDQIKDILEIFLRRDCKSRELFRSQVQHFLERLVRKMGYDKVLALVDEEQKGLVRYVEKERRKARKKKQDGGERKHKMQQFLDAVFRNDQQFEDEPQDSRNKRTPMEMEDKKQEESNLLLKYDLLRDRFHFAEETGRKLIDQEQKKKQEQETKQQKDVEFVNGKLVVRIDKNEEHEFGKKRRRENLELEEKIKNISKDESRHTKLAQTAATSNKNTMLTKKNRKVNKLEEKQQKGIHITKESGARFKLKGEQHGDVQKQNQPSPYAFIQLNPKVLNKRYKAQGVKSFEVLMKQSGSFKGIKEKKVKKD